MSNAGNFVQKLWGLCDILRDDGITYHQYVNELSYILFLKMAQETRAEEKFPDNYRWADIAKIKDANKQFKFYLSLLIELGTNTSEPIKTIFMNPTSMIRHSQSLKVLVEKINALDWFNARKEGFGDLYEGLLQKNATEVKSGAGQYFTPRPLIECIVNLTKPQAGEKIQDPAAGTCGFIVVSHDYINRQYSGKSKQRLLKTEYHAVELNQDIHRLALMNTFLHGIPSENIEDGDTLAPMGEELSKADLILTNPPFGTKKGSGRSSRKDLPFPTHNKQLAFLQHVYLGLKPGGRAAIVLPDNVLFEEGIGREIRKDLMEKCNLHTILRLPTGIFYAHGVKTNVLFFTRGKVDTGNTKRVWIYDMRTNVPTYGKRSPLEQEHFSDFEQCYGEESSGKAKRKAADSRDGRWKSFSMKEIKENNYNLDAFKWIEDKTIANPDNLPEPEELATEAITELRDTITELEAILSELETDTEEVA